MDRSRQSIRGNARGLSVLVSNVNTGFVFADENESVEEIMLDADANEVLPVRVNAGDKPRPQIVHDPVTISTAFI